jgi:hypothetical protein
MSKTNKTTKNQTQKQQRSLGMLTEFSAEHAFDYSAADFAVWARAAGFERTEALHLGGAAGAVIAHKAAAPQG